MARAPKIRWEIPRGGMGKKIMEDSNVMSFLNSETHKLKNDLKMGIGQLPGWEHATFEVVEGRDDTTAKPRPWKMIRVLLYGEKKVGTTLSWGFFSKYPPSKLKTEMYRQLKGGAGYFKMRKSASGWGVQHEKGRGK